LKFGFESREFSAETTDFFHSHGELVASLNCGRSQNPRVWGKGRGGLGPLRLGGRGLGLRSAVGGRLQVPAFPSRRETVGSEVETCWPSFYI